MLNINVDRVAVTERLGTVTIVDTWWQTETVSIVISPLWGVTAAEGDELVSGCRRRRACDRRTSHECQQSC